MNLLYPQVRVFIASPAATRLLLSHSLLSRIFPCMLPLSSTQDKLSMLRSVYVPACISILGPTLFSRISYVLSKVSSKEKGPQSHCCDAFVVNANTLSFTDTLGPANQAFLLAIVMITLIMMLAIFNILGVSRKCPPLPSPCLPVTYSLIAFWDLPLSPATLCLRHVAIVTNGRLRSGGPYFLISRTLGGELCVDWRRAFLKHIIAAVTTSRPLEKLFSCRTCLAWFD